MSRWILPVVLTFAFASLAAAQSAAPKKRVAILDFDSVAGSVPANPYLQTAAANPGKTAADLLVNKLVEDKACSVIERTAIEKLLTEQNLSNSDRSDPLTAAKLGKIFGVDAIVLGSITRYDRDDQTSNGSGVSLGGFGSRTPKTKHDIKAVAQISARIISTDTAEVLAVAQGSGEIERKMTTSSSPGLVISRAAGVLGGGLANDPLLSEALQQAVMKLASDVEGKLPSVPAHPVVLDGLVAAIRPSGELILNVGARDGIKPGDRLEVQRLLEPIRDPATGRILRWEQDRLGEASVTEADDVSAIAMFSGSQAVKVGDHVRRAIKTSQ